MRLFILLAAFVCLAFPVSGLAQDITAPNKGTYEDIPYEYLEEADQFYQTCQNDTEYTNFFDCQCLAVEYLDERIESGPERQGKSIILAIRDQCHDATGIAGVTYNECVQNGALIMNLDTTMEDYCSCFANEYGKLFEDSGRKPNSKTFVKLKSKAHGICRRKFSS